MDEKEELRNDIELSIKYLDSILDDMYDRLCFDPQNNESDLETSNFVENMKKKYNIK